MNVNFGVKTIKISELANLLGILVSCILNWTSLISVLSKKAKLSLFSDESFEGYCGFKK